MFFLRGKIIPIFMLFIRLAKKYLICIFLTAKIKKFSRNCCFEKPLRVAHKNKGDCRRSRINKTIRLRLLSTAVY
jgi:hypothetical protein